MNKQQLAIIDMVLMVENKYFSNIDWFCLKFNGLFGSLDYDYTFWFDYFHVMSKTLGNSYYKLFFYKSKAYNMQSQVIVDHYKQFQKIFVGLPR
jgi:hypothetical protein